MKINTRSAWTGALGAGALRIGVLGAGALALLGTAPAGTVLLQSAHAASEIATAPAAYSADASVKIPDDYREWIYLSSGFDMSYNPALRTGHHMFDNVFVNPQAYHEFLQTGTWPDHTVLVLEGRGALDKGSINQAGQFQSPQVMAREVHIKDQARFAGGWAFFALDTTLTGRMIPRTADCYSCHAAHAVVDTTFVQFYPTLLPIATARGTVVPDHATSP